MLVALVYRAERVVPAVNGPFSVVSWPGAVVPDIAQKLSLKARGLPEWSSVERFGTIGAQIG